MQSGYKSHKLQRSRTKFIVFRNCVDRNGFRGLAVDWFHVLGQSQFDKEADGLDRGSV